MSNTQVIEKGILRAREIIDQRILASLIETAFDLETLRPFGIKWTGNLLDSIGCGIYKSGSLLTFSIPNPIATDPRSGESDFPAGSRQEIGSERPLWDVPSGVDADKAWIGEDALFNMLRQPPSQIARMKEGYALYYVAAMPYAEVVDETHNGVVLFEEKVPTMFKYYIKSHSNASN